MSDEQEREWEIFTFDAEPYCIGSGEAYRAPEILACSEMGERAISAVVNYIEDLRAKDFLTPADVVRRLRGEVAAHLAGLNVSEPRRALETAEDVLGNMLMLVRMTLDRMEDNDDAA